MTPFRAALFEIFRRNRLSSLDFWGFPHFRFSVSIFYFTIILIIAPISADEYLPPLSCEPQFTSIFAEYRVGHFHAGVDYRTPDGEGMPIIAPSKGSVIRARETPWGYGKALYFETADKRVAVFAHLSAFSEAISAKMDSAKFREKRNTAELWFKEGELTYTAGEIIAYSGSSGAGKPHLHFELRDGLDKVINPQLAGFINKDELSPNIEAIWIVPRSQRASVSGGFSPKRFEVISESGVAHLKNKSPIKARGELSFCIEVHDRESAKNANRFGVHSLELVKDGKTLFSYRANSFYYSETRQIGLLFDLGLQEEMGLSKPPFRLDHPFGADVALISGLEGDGVIEIEGDSCRIAIIASDFAGNETILEFTIFSAPELPEIAFELENRGDSIIVHSELSSDDTISLFLEYRADKAWARAKVPTEKNPTVLPAASRARLKLAGGNNPIWLYNYTNSEPRFDISLPGADVAIIKTIFSEPPYALPILKRGKTRIFPEMLNDSSFAFRFFSPKDDEKFKIELSEREFSFESRFLNIKSKAKLDLVGGWRIELPEASTFVPFVARDTTIQTDFGSALSLEPTGILLRRNARILFDSKWGEGTCDKLCIVRIWNGKIYFVSADCDERGRLVGDISSFGVFTTLKDTIPPILEPTIADGDTVRARLVARVSDDLSGFSLDVLPNSYIDGAWLPTEYDPEAGTATVSLSKISQGEHIWRIEASDVAGNFLEKKVKFYKK